MTSGENPYGALPRHAFWRNGVVENDELDHIYEAKFPISPDARIATAGSCFAQHISRYLRKNGYRVLDVEPPPKWLDSNLYPKFGYGIYSARYGNIYTLPQLLQLAQQVVGSFEPHNFCWRKGEALIDGLRPAIEPEGFASESELRLHRKHHIERVGELFRSTDLLIFTLGLTESWIDRGSGTVFPMAPGVYGGAYSEDEHSFVNYNYHQLEESFREFLSEIALIRSGKGLPKILLTVSPVPLTATASGSHVLKATTYSKAVLRALAGQLAQSYDFVDYFPSYEIVTNPARRGSFFESNLRTVTPQGVDAAMRAFFAAHSPLTQPVLRDAEENARGRIDNKAMIDRATVRNDVECEEAILEAFGG